MGAAFVIRNAEMRARVVCLSIVGVVAQGKRSVGIMQSKISQMTDALLLLGNSFRWLALVRDNRLHGNLREIETS